MSEVLSAREAWAIIGIGGHARYRTMPAGQTSNGFPILWAVDPEGRPCLLVACTQTEGPRRQLRGAELCLTTFEHPASSSRHFVVVKCRNLAFLDLFEGFAEELRTELLRTDSDPYRVCQAALENWRRFFELERTGLSREREVGLFGELRFLELLADWGLPAVQHWVGPTGHRHDFTFADCDVECKTTEGAAFVFEVANVVQLESVERRPLYVCAQRVEQQSGGETVAQKIERLRRKVDSIALARRLAELEIPPDLSSDDCRPLTSAELRMYRVDEGFPRITAAMVDVPGVSGVRYRTDLSVAPQLVVDLEDLRKLLVKIGDA